MLQEETDHLPAVSGLRQEAEDPVDELLPGSSSPQRQDGADVPQRGPGEDRAPGGTHDQT